MRAAYVQRLLMMRVSSSRNNQDIPMQRSLNSTSRRKPAQLVRRETAEASVARLVPTISTMQIGPVYLLTLMEKEKSGKCKDIESEVFPPY
jgi:hypothetical protein